MTSVEIDALWTLTKRVGGLEKKIDHLVTSHDRFMRALRWQRSSNARLRGQLAEIRKYAKELEGWLKLQREGEKI